MALAEPSSERSIAAVAVLRGIAPLVVIWCHLVGGFVDGVHTTWLPLTSVRAVTGPLGIIQDGGFLGVSLFFVISGFIITHVGLPEDARSFAVKRALRIYPPLVVAIIVILVFAHAMAFATGHPSYWTTLGGVDALASMTLLQRFVPGSLAVDDVTWTLLVEVAFYALCLCVLPIIRRSAAGGVIAMLGAIALLTIGGATWGAAYWLFAASVVMVPYLVMGQITYLVWSRRLGRSLGVALGVATYALLIVRSETFAAHTLWAGNRYDVQFGYALVAFVLLLALGKRLRVPRVLRATSAMSYSLYLYHAPVGLLIMGEVFPRYGYPAALATALVAVFAVSWASWRFVEVPAQHAARGLLARWRGTRQPLSLAPDTVEPQPA